MFPMPGIFHLKFEKVGKALGTRFSIVEGTRTTTWSTVHQVSSSLQFKGGFHGSAHAQASA